MGMLGTWGIGGVKYKTDAFTDAESGEALAYLTAGKRERLWLLVLEDGANRPKIIEAQTALIKHPNKGKWERLKV